MKEKSIISFMIAFMGIALLLCGVLLCFCALEFCLHV